MGYYNANAYLRINPTKPRADYRRVGMPSRNC